MILSAGVSSALATEQWTLSLDLNAAVLASAEARGASIHDIACFRFNDYGPLIRLGRLGEAGRLLTECQQVFENRDNLDISMLAKVLYARADLEEKRGNLQAALSFGITAIRYAYVRPDPNYIAVSHHNYAVTLGRAGTDPATQRAHRLAATLIFQLIGMTHEFGDAIRALAIESRRGDQEGLPSTLSEVIEVVEQTVNVRFGQLITALEPATEIASAAIAQILDAAAAYDLDSDHALADSLRRWDPVIDLTVAAAAGDHEAAAELASGLDILAESAELAPLGAVLRRIAAGERGDDLLDGLSPIGTAIAAETLSRLSQPPAAPGTRPN